jgi:hypothetical protein
MNRNRRRHAAAYDMRSGNREALAEITQKLSAAFATTDEPSKDAD